VSSPDEGRHPRVVIAIDGPAASGKSSTAQWVARILGYRHVDSGALYRAATAAILRTDPAAGSWTPDRVLDAAGQVTLAETPLSFEPRIGGQRVDEEIRSPEVTRHVSRVAQMMPVRQWVNERLRAVARRYDVVVDGRDMGTAVFPRADLKVYLVADPWERARRRLTQRLQRRPSDEEIAEETDRLVQRDATDATQSLQARGAVLVDTTYLTQPEQVERIVALARAVNQRPADTSAVENEDQRD
jgi:cytidylate kinase